MWVVLAVGTLSLIAPFSMGVCPDYYTSATATAWSSLGAVAGDIVTITSEVIVNSSPNVDLGGIVIGDGGKLVFAADVEGGIVLRTNYIHIIDGGSMDIGSETCNYEGKVTIKLLGEREPGYDIESFGDKFIGVDVGGTLEIHGKYKPSWTKLASSLLKLEDDSIVYEDEMVKKKA